MCDIVVMDSCMRILAKSVICEQEMEILVYVLPHVSLRIVEIRIHNDQVTEKCHEDWAEQVWNSVIFWIRY